jgi:hypothetical protein
MKNNYHQKIVEKREELNNNPEALEVQRQKYADKYYKSIERKNKKTIATILERKDVCNTFKAFLRKNVLPAVDKGLPKSFLKMCWNYCSILENEPKETQG